LITDEVAPVVVPVELLAETVNVYGLPFTNGETEQVTAGEMIVQVPTELPDPSFAVTVNEEGVPPPTPGATVIVAPASLATAEEIVGAAGAETTHCAVRVILSLTAEISVFPATVVVPVLHPSKLNPDLLMSVATAVVNESPLVTSA
jgi:hypothetical protein